MRKRRTMRGKKNLNAAFPSRTLRRFGQSKWNRRRRKSYKRYKVGK